MSDGKERLNDIIRFIMLAFPVLGVIAIVWQLKGYSDRWLHVFISIMIYVIMAITQSWWTAVLLLLHSGGIIWLRDEKSESEIARLELQRAQIDALTKQNKEQER